MIEYILGVLGIIILVMFHLITDELKRINKTLEEMATAFAVTASILADLSSAQRPQLPKQRRQSRPVDEPLQ